MTARQAKLQTLIAEIEALLGKASPRLPWVMAGEANQQRRILEETYQYLKALDEAAPGGWGSVDPVTGEIIAVTDDSMLSGHASEANSQQVLQALLQEMQYLRSQTLQPLRTEVIALQQQREQLLNEVRQLERQRLQAAQSAEHTLPPPLVDELVDRLRETLLNQLQPQFQSPPGSQMSASLYGDADLPAIGAGRDLPQLHPQQRLEQLRHIQAQTDYMLLKLDTNLRAVFESMEQSIQSYRDSLHQGIDTMHGLGQQGEVIFKTLINHLAQQLGQEQTAYLDADVTSISAQPPLAAQATPAQFSEPVSRPDIDRPDIDRQAGDRRAAESLETVPDLDVPSVESADPADPDADLALSIDLDDLDLGEPLDGDQDITLFQLDEEITQIQLDGDKERATDQAGDNLPDEDVTLMQTEPWPGLSEQPDAETAASSNAIVPSDETPNTEIDALYESLFGDANAPAPPDSEASTSAVKRADDPLEQALFETDTGSVLDAGAPNDNPDGSARTGNEATAELSVDDSRAAAASPVGHSGPISEPVSEPIMADLSLETLEPDLGLFEIPAEITASLLDRHGGELSASLKLSDLLGPDEAPMETGAQSEEATLAANTIESLAELLPSEGEAVAPLFEGMAPDLEVDEDSFIPAPSDEDLLSNPPGATPWDPALKLNADALDQLSVDLSNLEGSAADPSPTDPPAEAAAEATAEAATKATAEAATEAAQQPVLPDLTLETEAPISDQAPALGALEPPLGALDLDPGTPTLETEDPSLSSPLNLARGDLLAPDLSLELDLTPTADSEAAFELETASAPNDFILGADDEGSEDSITLESAFGPSSDNSLTGDIPTETVRSDQPAEEDISALLATWTADADVLHQDHRPASDAPDATLANFDDLGADLFATDAPPSEATESLSLSEDIFELALEDVSFELDLPSVAQGYVSEQPDASLSPSPSREADVEPVDEAVNDPISDMSLATFESELGDGGDAPESLDSFSFGDGEEESGELLTASNTLDDLTSEAVSLNDLVLGDADRFSLDDVDLNLDLDLDPDLLFEPPPVMDEGRFEDQASSTIEAVPEETVTLASLDDLGSADQISVADQKETTVDAAQPNEASTVTTLESLENLGFGDSEPPPISPEVPGESRITTLESLNDLELFATEEPVAEGIELFPAEEERDANATNNAEPIELFPNEAVAPEPVPETTPDLDLADPGFLDLFPPLTASGPLDATLTQPDEGLIGDEAIQADAGPSPVDDASEAGNPLTLEALLALEEPEPSLPEGWTIDSDLEGNASEDGPFEMTDPTMTQEADDPDDDGWDDGAVVPELSLTALDLTSDQDVLLSSFRPNVAAIAVAEPDEATGALVDQAESPDLASRQPEDPIIAPESEQDWFLGIDLGTTGLSAVLMNRFDGQAYPLYWTDAGIASTTAENLFRWPTVAVLHPSGDRTQWRLGATGSEALTLNWQGDASQGASARLAMQLKSWLAVGLPYREDSGDLHPQLQWSDQDTLPLQQVVVAVKALLSTLGDLKTAAGDLPIGAAGLDEQRLGQIFQQIQGVVIGHSPLIADTYRINLREVILETQLVSTASQVLFIEDAIAAVLSGLPDPSAPLTPASNQTQTLYQCHWQGGTVVINAGASSTDLGLANLPSPLNALSREDFTLRSLAYGGDALDLDIICQLLIPADRRQTRSTGSKPPQGSGWDWQAASPEVQNSRWATLELEALDLPRIAEPDLAARIPLRQRLESSPLGQSLLEAARHGKLILQNQAQFHLELGDQSWRVLRRDLESRILVPYIQRINQHLNALMSETGLPSQSIHQVICTGGNASFATIARWLRQKFPNATIIQDTYPSDRPPSCSRIAYGLVNLCRYPQVLDGPRHQYSDYFLLQELLRVMPDQPMPLQGIMHLLEQQGVNTEVCHPRILALLEGHLPAGLVPDMAGRSHLSAKTLNSDLYRALVTDVLFMRQSGQIYAPHVEACQRMEAHLQRLMVDKLQSLSEPLLAQWVTP